MWTQIGNTRRRLTPWMAGALWTLGQLLAAGPVAAQSVGRLIREASESLGKSSDEALASSARLLDRLAKQSDDQLQAAGRQLAGDAAAKYATADALAALRNAGWQDAGPSLTRQLDALDDAGRKSLVAILEQSQRVTRLALQSGTALDEVAGVIDEAGSGALVSLRSMQTAEGVRDCVAGYRRFGPRFAEFVQRGDEGAVRQLARRLDEVDNLPAAQVDDLLRNPAKYFAPDGQPTKALDELLAGTRRSAPGDVPAKPQPQRTPLWKQPIVWGAGLAALALAPDRWFEPLEEFLPEPIYKLIRSLRWAAWWGLLAMIGWFAWPLVAPLLWSLLRLGLRLLRFLPGWLGRKAAGWLDRVPDPRDSDRTYRPRLLGGPPAEELRIGLLGSRRAGKSTFIVMLTKYLNRLVDGASLRTHAEHPDGEILANMVQEISRCRPTVQDKRIRLDLSWPFRRDGSRFEAGKLDQELVLSDFPGEWAAPQAAREDRRKLVGHLRDVDGLFVVVDPTDLEAEDEGDRLRQQEEAIESMFKADGLALGRRFQRALGVMITKRDAIDRPTLARLAQRRGLPRDEAFDAMAQLLDKPQLTCEESARLGAWLLDLIFPGKLEELKTRLAAAEAADTRSWWGRWLGRQTRPQLSVFAVSQLGLERGRQVVEHRRQVQAWEKSDRQGPRPEIELDLAEVDAAQLDLHHPFRWMFDHIPEGWLHQAQAHPGPRGFWYRRSLYRRFRGSPAVQQDRRVTWKRCAAIVTCVVLLGLSTQPLMVLRERWRDARQVAALFELACEPGTSTAELREGSRRCRNLPTRPYVTQLNDFEELLAGAGQLEDYRAQLSETGRPPALQVQDALDWLRRCDQLPPEQTGWLQPLRDYRASLTRPQAVVLDSLFRALTQSQQEFLQANRFDDALKQIGDCRYGLTSLKSPIPDGYLARLDQQHQSVSKTRQRYRFEGLKGQVQSLLGQEPPRYLEAIRLVATTTLDDPAAASEIGPYRQQLIEQFWRYTETVANQAIRDDDFPLVDRVLGEFHQVPDPNPLRRQGEEYQRSLPDKRVAVKTELARGDLEDRDFAGSWAQLESARLFLSEAQPETRRAWYRTAVDVKTAQALWADAVILLRDLGGEPWGPEEQSRVWRAWQTQLQDEVSRLLAAGQVDEARRKVEQFFAASDWGCPAEVRQQMQQIADRIPAANVAKTLRDAAGLPEQEAAQAVRMLRGLRVDIERIDDESLLGEWRERVVAAHRVLGEHREAIRFLENLQQDPRLQKKIPVNPDAIGQLWSEHAQYLQQQVSRHVQQTEFDLAWRKLREALQDGQAPAPFVASLGDFAAVQLALRMKNVRDRARSDLQQSRFAAARQLAVEAGAEFGPWVYDPRFNLKAQLDQLELEIDQQELLSQVKTLREEFEQLPAEPCATRLDSLLGHPGLTDELRAALSRLRDDNLVRWEKRVYEDLRESRSNLELERAAELAAQYLAVACPYQAKQADPRREAVQQLQRWLEYFERPHRFALTAIAYRGFPNHWFKYDPAFQVRIADANQEIRIHGQQDSVWGDGEFRAFETNPAFEWKRGGTITIQIWDDRVDKKGRLIGSKTWGGAYALPLACLRMQPIDVKSGNFADDKGLEGLSVKLIVAGFEDLPDLPEYRALTPAPAGKPAAR